MIPYDPPREFHTGRAADVREKLVDLSCQPLESYDRTRAWIFPPFDGPFALVNGTKRHLTTLISEGQELVLDVGGGRRVYWANEKSARAATTPRVPAFAG